MAHTLSKKLVVITLLTLIFLLCGGLFLLPGFLKLDSYKEEILTEVQTALGRKVSYEKGDFSLRSGPAFIFSKIVVKEKDGSSDFITADRLTLKIALLPLLDKKLLIRTLNLEKPAIELSRDPSGMLNIQDLLEEKKESGRLQLRSFRLKNAAIRFRDKGVGPEEITTRLQGLDLVCDHLVRGKKADVKISALLATGGATTVQPPGSLSVSGTVRLAETGKPLTESILDLKLQTTALEAGHFWPYYRRFVPFRQILATLDLESTFKGKYSSFSAKGSVRLQQLRFDYPQIFHAILTPRDVRVKYDLELARHDILIKALDLTVDNLNVKGTCAIRDLNTRDPRITAHAITSRFRLEEFHTYVPYGIIVRDVADYIEQHIKGGTYRLDEGRLDGRVSQIVHMERGDNYNVLYISGRVENGLVSYGSSAPTFNSINGRLEMRGKDFNLQHMSGKFGNSPFTLDGKIADYPLNTPSSYHFTMNMTPQKGEVAWLFGWAKGNRPVITGESHLRLSGEGISSNYHLSGEWNLSPVSYTCSDLISKPAGRANNVVFRGSIDQREAKFTSVQYNLPPMNLAISGVYRFADVARLGLEIRSNQFAAGEIVAMIPRARKFEATGNIQGTVHVEAADLEAAEPQWSGTIALGGFGCKPPAPIGTIGNVNGTVTFNDSTLETSQLSGRIGSSTLLAKGTLIGLNNPELNASFSSPRFDLADVGLKSSGKAVRIGKMRGDIALKERDVQINMLSGQVNSSYLSLKGRIRNITNPQVDLNVTSPHLDLADVVLLASLEPVVKDHAPPRIAIKATVAAATARAGEAELSKLNAVAMYEDRILYLQPVECLIFGGKLSGKGRADFATPLPRYQVGFALEKVSAEKFARLIGIKQREFTGTLSLQGELTAKGENAADFKKSALGSLKLTAEKGTLRRFSVLSKVFSILNVAQLLKFQLPDMVSGGMPYNQVTGSFSVNDGTVATKDLFLASEAINISTVGKLDLVKNEIDVTIGVQPLQTLDKVVSKIPIVGWILTGSNKSLVTAYFEAKGNIDDPKVNAIPVKGMTKGVFDIFRRLFELPAKLFTDTGEVFIGK
jgi:uncharacterized protein involved in outer membrane biogenesis